MRTILFDLDGTLLPMNQDAFTEYYFGLLTKKMIPYGYEAKELVKAIWTGTKAMVLNDGTKKNQEAFWEKFIEIYGEKAIKTMDKFDEFYEKDFSGARESCGYNAEASKLIKKLKGEGYRLVLATNPIFPETATRQRVEWAGLNIEDFDIFTTYENSCYCKPNINYYAEILNRLDAEASDCLMVGNDVNEDMVAEQLGMSVFLLTDCLLNRENKDITVYSRGSFSELYEYIQQRKGNMLSNN